MSKINSCANMVSATIVDDVIKCSSDAHCWFDENGDYLSCSESTYEYFPELRSVLTPSISYTSVLKAICSSGSVLNLPQKSELDARAHKALSMFLGNQPLAYTRHLSNGISLHVKRMHVSDGRRLLIFNDVTQHRQSHALGDEKYRKIASISSNWYWSLDANLCYTHHSSHCQPLAGVDAESLVGKSRIIQIDGWSRMMIS